MVTITTIMESAVMIREELEARLAALHRVSLELVQDISLESLLERIAIIACEQVHASYAAMGVFSEYDTAGDGKLENFISVGLKESEIIRIGNSPEGKEILAWFILSPYVTDSLESIRIRDLASDPRSEGFSKDHPDMFSYMGVPIHLGKQMLGQIYLMNKVESGEFTLEDQQVIEILSGYAAVAITNARLYNQLSQREQILTLRNENLALLNELAVVLAPSTDIDLILEKALEQVMGYLHIESGDIFLRKEESRTMVLVHHRSECVNVVWEKTQFQIGEGIVGETAQNNKPRQISLPCNCSEDLYIVKGLDKFLSQLACFPLPGRMGVLGVLCVATSHKQPLDDKEVQLLTTVGSWLGTAVENIRLNIQQRRLAVLEERERIGMDLHDGIIQSIYAVGLTLEHAQLLLKEKSPLAVDRIQQSIKDLNSTIRDIRAYILDLRPRQLYDEDLLQGVHRLISEFRANTLVDVNLQSSSDGIARLPQPQAIALFHICQESLANIAKHAQARRVNISLWTTADRALMELSDDGRGFDLQKVKFSLGHGLSNIQTRAHNAGGEVEITSEPGEGATILVWVPIG